MGKGQKYLLLGSGQVRQFCVWKISPTKIPNFQLFYLLIKKISTRCVKKILRSTPDRPLIYCGSEDARVGSGYISIPYQFSNGSITWMIILMPLGTDEAIISWSLNSKGLLLYKITCIFFADPNLPLLALSKMQTIVVLGPTVPQEKSTGRVAASGERVDTTQVFYKGP